MELPSIPPENIEIEEEIEPTRESWSGEMERQEEVELGENEDGEMVFESGESWKEENMDEEKNKGDKVVSPEENNGEVVFESGESWDEENIEEGDDTMYNEYYHD